MLVIDAPHDAAPIVEAIGGRRVTAIVLTHGHNDHITAAVDLREATGAPIWFNPADRMLWDVVHPDAAPDRELDRGRDVRRRRGDADRAAHPGPLPRQHLPVRARTSARSSPATRCSAAGPGATGRSFSDKPTIVESIRDAAADPARRHRRPHRARRRHDDRRGGRTSPERTRVTAGRVLVVLGRGPVPFLERWRIAATFSARSSSASTARVASANMRFSRCSSALGTRGTPAPSGSPPPRDPRRRCARR